MAQPVAELSAPPAQQAVNMLAVRLLKTTPHTSDHCNAWGAFRLGSMMWSELNADYNGEELTGGQVSTDYLKRLGMVAGHLPVHVIISPLDWTMERWRKDEERTLDAIVAPHGYDVRLMSEEGILEGLASAVMAVRDRRAWDARHLARAAFRLPGPPKPQPASGFGRPRRNAKSSERTQTGLQYLTPV